MGVAIVILSFPDGEKVMFGEIFTVFFQNHPNETTKLGDGWRWDSYLRDFQPLFFYKLGGKGISAPTSHDRFKQINTTRWWFQILVVNFHPYPLKDDPIWLAKRIFFQMGWNHQLDTLSGAATGAVTLFWKKKGRLRGHNFFGEVSNIKNGMTLLCMAAQPNPPFFRTTPQK